jgi:heterodisulfide reductase subunit A-like polyferredoxin
MRKALLFIIFLLLMAFLVLTACKHTSTTEFTVDRSACNGCGRCLQVCPYDAIELDNNGKAVIDQTLCQQDGLCVRACPQNAIY